MSGFNYIETNRKSKAQKRRDAKAAKRTEQLERIKDAEKLDEHKDRKVEQEKLDSLLAAKQLMVHEVEADGDCLYRAVEHQLSLANDSLERLTHKELRERTSQYMLDNSDKFMPFLLNDTGNLMSQIDFNNYCLKIASTREWGGHLELTAISHFTRKPIHIYQAENRTPIIIEPETSNCDHKNPILLSFHKHLYHLGEHYNSLVPMLNNAPFDELAISVICR